MEQIYFRLAKIAEILDVSPSTVKRLGDSGAIEVEYFGPKSPRYRLPRSNEEWERYRRAREKAFPCTAGRGNRLESE
jgi:hypothetical protein